MRLRVEDIVAHIIATIITVGFFATVMISLLGYVNLQDATTASFMGSIVGFIAGSLNVVLSRYFRPEQQTEIPHSMQGKSGLPVAGKRVD